MQIITENKEETRTCNILFLFYQSFAKPVIILLRMTDPFDNWFDRSAFVLQRQIIYYWLVVSCSNGDQAPLLRNNSPSR